MKNFDPKEYLNSIPEEDRICSECKGKADEGYFAEDGSFEPPILFICQTCREAFSATIRGMIR